jgi:hypothetical protein
MTIKQAIWEKVDFSSLKELLCMYEWLQYGISSGLSLVAGTNAYAPLLSLALTGRWGQTSIHPALAFLTTDWCIILLILFVIFDFIADKIPGVSAIWNTLHTILKPLAAGMISLAIISPHDSLLFVATAINAFYALAGALFKISIRTVLSTWTAGLSNPIVSLIEDVLTIIGIVLSFAAPLFMLLVAGVALLLLVLMSKRLTGILRYQWYLLRSLLGYTSTSPTGQELDHLIGKIKPMPTILAHCQLFWLTEAARKRKSIMRTVRLMVTENSFILLSPAMKKFPIIPIQTIRQLELQPKRASAILTVQTNTMRFQLHANKAQQMALQDTLTLLQNRYHIPCQIHSSKQARLFATSS